MGSRGIGRRRALAGGTAAFASALTIAGTAAPAPAATPPGWSAYETPGEHVYTVGPDTTALELAAAGSRGGGLAGGKGATVNATIPVTAGQRVHMLITPPAPASLDPAEAGFGGGAAVAIVCPAAPANCVTSPVLAAGGGGGSGAGTALLLGGAGGDAGLPGSDGATGATPGAAGRGGHGAADAAVGIGGIGGVGGAVPPACTGEPGLTGETGDVLFGGFGGSADNPAREGGDGGDGYYGGGGGGSAATCDGVQAGGAGGGGGGSSLVPAGGQLSVTPDGSGPSVRLLPVQRVAPPQPPPTPPQQPPTAPPPRPQLITIRTPAEGASYPVGTVVPASYQCFGLIIGGGSCTGTVADGAPIDTATAGPKTFTVTRTLRSGAVTTAQVAYSVTEPTPRMLRTGLRLTGVTRSTIRFLLSIEADVTVIVERRTLGPRRRGRRPVRWQRVRTVEHAGMATGNEVSFAGRARRALGPGTYRVAVEASAPGRTPASATSRTFTIRARRPAPRARGRARAGGAEPRSSTARRRPRYAPAAGVGAGAGAGACTATLIPSSRTCAGSTGAGAPVSGS